MRIVGVGDNTVDKYLHLKMMFPGGNAVNVPVLARRYGHDASYIGWLGDDTYGHLILDALVAEGLDVVGLIVGGSIVIPHLRHAFDTLDVLLAQAAG